MTAVSASDVLVRLLQSAGRRAATVLPQLWQPVFSLPDAAMLANSWFMVSSARTTNASPPPGIGVVGEGAGVRTAPGVSGIVESLETVLNVPFRVAVRPLGVMETVS